MQCTRTGLKVEGGIGELITALQDEILKLRVSKHNYKLLALGKTYGMSYDQVKESGNMIKAQQLDVDTLDHLLKFDGEKFKVGCQTITYDDAQKIASFIQEQDFIKPEKFYEVGTKFIRDNWEKDEFMLSQVTRGEYAFICLRSGNRWKAPVNPRKCESLEGRGHLKLTEIMLLEVLGESSLNRWREVSSK